MAQVRAMIDQGYLSLLVGDLGHMQGYWNQLLLDYPGHPAHGQEAQSIPLTLYGDLFAIFFCQIHSGISIMYWFEFPKTLLWCPVNFVFPCISGDEGNAFRSSWMTFHWQPDLSPLLQNSACSRFIITTVPSSMPLVTCK